MMPYLTYSRSSGDVLYAQASMTNIEIEKERLRQRCMELEHQLAAERNHREDQISDVQQRQIDEIIVKYKERMKAIEDEKMAVMLCVYLHYDFK